ncbi:MAG: site-specific DNA-methyltransferase [Burkholderiales bacterium]
MNDEQRQELIRRLQHGEELSPEWGRILFPPEKREYELVYHGKEREEDIIANTLAVPLQKVRTFGKNGDGWHNMLIFGDNLQVMKTLVDLKKSGKLCNADGVPGVRLVYIDPPFATKRDFSGSQEQKAYQDKIAGARFLEFLRKRLVLIRELLSEDGYVFVHLDQKKSHYIKALMDEIFGDQNFLNHIIWSYRRWPSSSRNFQAMHDDILMYAAKAKDPERAFNIQYEPPSESYVKRFQGKTQILDEETGTRKITVDEPTKGMPLRDVWDISIVAGFKSERTDYPTQKPETLAARIIEVCSDEGDIVFDAFAGSGTTLAVAEKLGRRWVGIDCGKLAIYTVQKRMLNLRVGIGHYGKNLTAKPFGLYNAGLYDFSKLKELQWDAWRFFALQLFQSRDEPHKIGGIQLDGYLKGSSVLVFNHQNQPGVRIDEETIQSMHEALGSKVGSRIFIIAPALVFDFQQDYLTLDGVRYYALRIPYSIIHELHQREFAALKQPADELAVNDTVDAVGFDFVRRPELEYEAGVNKRKGELIEEGFIKIKTFKSEAVVREPMRKKGNRETLSMVMLDYDFDSESDVFAFDAVFYAEAIEKANWEVRFPVEAIGNQVMAVFVDIYGNEAREVIPASRFGVGKAKATKAPKKTRK